MNKIQYLFLRISRFKMPMNLRRLTLKLSGITLPKTSNINEGIKSTLNNITIGENGFINKYCQFEDGFHGGSVTIEDNVMIGPNVHFCTVSHNIGSKACRAGKTFLAPIVIKKGCWICIDSTILPGVTIEDGCVIAAGSIVTKSTYPNGLYAGAPAQRIKDLD